MGEDTIFITDRTGKLWDITHAVYEYGFDPANFEHGLGPNAIEPIQNPKMLSPGNPGYPDPEFNDLVIGITLNGESRAYLLDDLFGHEIANDRFGETYVAVGF